MTNISTLYCNLPFTAISHSAHGQHRKCGRKLMWRNFFNNFSTKLYCKMMIVLRLCVCICRHYVTAMYLSVLVYGIYWCPFFRVYQWKWLPECVCLATAACNCLLLFGFCSVSCCLGFWLTHFWVFSVCRRHTTENKCNTQKLHDTKFTACNIVMNNSLKRFKSSHWTIALSMVSGLNFWRNWEKLTTTNMRNLHF